MRRRIAAAGVLFLLAVAASASVWSALAKPALTRPGPVAIRIEASPIPSFQRGNPTTRFGALDFRGGLVLTADNADFGGISGLSVDARGERFVAISDAGLWITGRFVEQDGRLAGVDDASLAPVLGEGRVPLASRRAGDTESLAIQGGTAYVGIEGVNQIRRFAFGRDGVMAEGRPIKLPPEASHLPGNLGFEAVGIAPQTTAVASAVVAIAERSDGHGETTRGYLVGGPAPGSFLVRRSEDFDVSDLAFLPDGDLLLLERRVSLLSGFAMRIRRIAASSLRAGATLDGETLIEASLGSEIDNMEALAVSRNERGETILTVMSDDNFSLLERSIVLRFALRDP